MPSTLENAKNKPATPSMASRVIAFAVVAVIAVLGAMWVQENILQDKSALESDNTSHDGIAWSTVEEIEEADTVFSVVSDDKASEVNTVATANETGATLSITTPQPANKSSTPDVTMKVAETTPATETSPTAKASSAYALGEALRGMVAKAGDIAVTTKNALVGTSTPSKTEHVATIEVEEITVSESLPLPSSASSEELTLKQPLEDQTAAHQEKLNLVQDVLKKEMTRRRDVEAQLSTTTKTLLKAQEKLNQNAAKIIRLQKQIEKLEARPAFDPATVEPAAAAPATVIHIREAWQKGEDTSPFVKEALTAAKKIERPAYVAALKEIKTTIKEPAVTQLQLLNATQQVLAQGAPKAIASHLAATQSHPTPWYSGVADMVTVRKVTAQADESSWRMTVHKLQNLIVANQISEAQSLLSTSPALRSDTRLNELNGLLKTYAGQQSTFRKARHAAYR